MAVGTGEAVIDFAMPEPSPPPITTIAWRMAHIAIGVFGMRAANHFGGRGVSATRRRTSRSPRRAAWRCSTATTTRGSAASASSTPPGCLARAALPRARTPRHRWPSSCCTSTARRCTMAQRSPCCSTCTPTDRRFAMTVPTIPDRHRRSRPALPQPVLVCRPRLRDGGPPRHDRGGPRRRLGHRGRSSRSTGAERGRPRPPPVTRTATGPRLLFQQVPEAKTVKNRVHLDVQVGEERRRGRGRTAARPRCHEALRRPTGAADLGHARRPRGQRVLSELETAGGSKNHAPHLPMKCSTSTTTRRACRRRRGRGRPTPRR